MVSENDIQDRIDSRMEEVYGATGGAIALGSSLTGGKYRRTRGGARRYVPVGERHCTSLSVGPSGKRRCASFAPGYKGAGSSGGARRRVVKRRGGSAINVDRLIPSGLGGARRRRVVKRSPRGGFVGPALLGTLAGPLGQFLIGKFASMLKAKGAALIGGRIVKMRGGVGIGGRAPRHCAESSRGKSGKKRCVRYSPGPRRTVEDVYDDVVEDVYGSALIGGRRRRAAPRRATGGVYRRTRGGARGQLSYVDFIKDYAASNGISFKDALIEVKEEGLWRKK